MRSGNRISGIDIIENVPWGTHLCQFYQTKEDLMDMLIPYSSLIGKNSMALACGYYDLRYNGNYFYDHEKILDSFIGMQLVTSLVDQLDGELQLKRNNGTEFTIRFTVAKK
jgi:hypothetical protein